MNNRTICLDIDGVLATMPQGGLHPGALSFVSTLSQKHRLIVHTSRDPQQAFNWLRVHGLDGYIWQVTKKPEAIAYIDDRAVRFTGNFDRALLQTMFKLPWWREKK